VLALLACGCAKILGFERGEPEQTTGGNAQGGTNAGVDPLTSGTNGSDLAGAGGDASDAAGGQAGAAGAPPDLCGNGKLDDGEECDGDKLGEATCYSLGHAGGRLGCESCEHDLSECYDVRSLDVFSHACAVLSNDKLKCWGANSVGQLGIGDTDDWGEEADEMGEGLPFVDLGKRLVLQVSTGYSHTCVLVVGNEVICWGANDSGQLGVPNEGNVLVPPTSAVALGDDAVVVQVSAGGAHTCALLNNGRVKCWGSNDRGQLGLGHTQSRGKQLGEMGNNLPFVDLGKNIYGEPLEAKAIEASGSHTCALTEYDVVKCWGHNGQGALGIGSFEENRGEAAKEMGDALPAVNLGFMSNELLSAGGHHNCVKTVFGLKCWGYNGDGQLGYGDYESRGSFPEQMGEALPYVDLGFNPSRAEPLYIAGLSAGYTHTCAWFVLSAGMKCWGSNIGGELGLGDVESRGNLLEQMGDHLPFVDLGTGHTIASVHAGMNVTCAILTPGRVKCWGWNNQGTLGAGHGNNVGVAPGQMGDALPFVRL
jgi:E3 ubiquitin-protein ligase HERC3